MAEPTSIVPDKGIRPGLNETGVTIGKSLMVNRVAGNAPDSVALAGAGGAALGLTMEAILDDERGDVQIEGQGIGTAGAAVARGALVMATATGKLITATATNISLGRARSAAAADGDLFEVELYPVGSGQTEA